ncbi:MULTISPECIES: TetR/AcrR family transcriptional regulator [unclassified Paenibacillus]|uniref:TetR/AcrR family transcriptional regulator n=1 Tax=unclassified Paenibacillus TaxID=185978 RepID=UPI002406C3D4|nr:MULTISPECIES: TetR/AcrR family transcriptional regulator [unclassified Paenibacillus]MDF9844394.1 AcrR family transcriptional regulator [Paenibacillus sp. PastF-2]MDF9850998.1 AcrR family transcriptional regulator [Paenibacillus sp. PastM-2]MDF9857569.1 AcrR family transcriptional regulator [Paenibacillus sp. PastF-1]MDH6482790.1 AcrR family transcriptional regulator [Paenibacillus sp. PastH-2]MDH6510216.1 AcrR family transcriptional regulator [Paenibacillus sp. PastM-3]
MSKKTDLRVIRTRKLIKEAFLTLVEEKGFDAITIQDIADHAIINRATFYLHYYDKHDLLEKLTEEVFKELAQLIKPTSYVKNNEVLISKLEKMIQNIFENIGENIRFYQVMLGNNGIYGVNSKIQTIIKSNFKQEFLLLNLYEKDLSIPMDLLVEFMASALMGMIRWWIINDQIYSPKHMSKNLVKIITMGPLEAAGLKIEDK